MILQKLAKLANKLDAKGYYKLASELDKIAETMTFKDDVVEGKQWTPARKLYYNTLNKIRKELGLGSGNFDRQMGNRLRKMYPGAWDVGNKRQTAREILQNIQQMKAQKSQPEPFDPGRRGEPTGEMQHPEQYFPSTHTPQDELSQKADDLPELTKDTVPDLEEIMRVLNEEDLSLETEDYADGPRGGQTGQMVQPQQYFPGRKPQKKPIQMDPVNVNVQQPQPAGPRGGQTGQMMQPQQYFPGKK